MIWFKINCKMESNEDFKNTNLRNEDTYNSYIERNYIDRISDDLVTINNLDPTEYKSTLHQTKKKYGLYVSGHPTPQIKDEQKERFFNMLRTNLKKYHAVECAPPPEDDLIKLPKFST